MACQGCMCHGMDIRSPWDAQVLIFPRGAAIILNVEEIAGAERADGLSQRIAMLLPPEQ